MKTIAIQNNKGGVGKTATLTTIAHMFPAIFGKNTLIVDMDPQRNTSQLFGFSENEQGVTLSEILSGRLYPATDTVEDILLDSQKDIHECIYKTDYDKLSIIPAYLTLSNVENQLLGDVTAPQQYRLKSQLEKIRGEYEYCFIDCGPSISLLNVNALAAADEVYIPSKSDMASRVGIANIVRLMKTVQGYHPRLNLGGCFLTQYDERKRICREAWQDCKSALGEKFLPIAIPTNTKVEQTGKMQKPLYELDPHGKATQKYIELAEFMLLEEEERLKFIQKSALEKLA